jgi:hypothetical protein
MVILDDLTPPEEEPADVKLLRAALRRLQSQLLQAKDRTEHLTEITQQAAFDAMIALGGVKQVTAPTKDKRKGGAEVALWVMGDWQGGKRTPSYDSDVMRERVMKFVDKAVTITNIQRSHHPVRDATIAFTGDMVEGLFNFPSQPHELD